MLSTLVKPSAMLILFIPLAYCQESDKSSVVNILESKRTIISNIESDLLNFLKSPKIENDSNEYFRLDSLRETASVVYMNIDSTIAFLDIYNKISRKDDRNLIIPIINRKVKLYIKLLDSSINFVNRLLPNIHVPAIAVSASRLRDEFREIEELLNSINLP